MSTLRGTANTLLVEGEGPPGSGELSGKQQGPGISKSKAPEARKDKCPHGAETTPPCPPPLATAV